MRMRRQRISSPTSGFCESGRSISRSMPQVSRISSRTLKRSSGGCLHDCFFFLECLIGIYNTSFHHSLSPASPRAWTGQARKIIKMLLLLLFIPSVSALTTPRPILISNNQTMAGEHSTNNTSNPTGPNYLACRTNIEGIKLGDSCANAWAKIPRTTSENVYVSRREKPPAASDIVVPIRYLSDDSLCAIDIRARERDTVPDPGDIAQSIDISDVADLIIKKCVERSGRGGISSGFSKRIIFYSFGLFIFLLLYCFRLSYTAQSGHK